MEWFTLRSHLFRSEVKNMDKNLMSKSRNYSYWIIGGLLLIICLSLIPWETVIPTGPKVGIVEINTPITDSKYIVKELNYFEEESGISAIVVRLETPGGGVAVSQEIYEKVKKISENSSKPIIASMGGIAASGGYYIAVAADTIIANPGTVTGSIGVIMTYPVVQELMQKLGVEHETIKSGGLKDAGSIFRDMSEKERIYWQSLIDNLHSQFVTVVSTERNLSLAEMEELADGRVFSGIQALDAGLIDMLGTMEDAVFIAAQKSGIKGKPVMVYPPEDKKGLLNVLFGDILQRTSLAKLNLYPQPEYKIIYQIR